MKERLQKILSGRGVASRRRAEELITAGMVTVNGAVAALGDCADPDVDEILVGGKSLPGKTEYVYILLNKPRGYVTTLSDEKGRPNAAQLVEGCGVRVPGRTACPGVRASRPLVGLLGLSRAGVCQEYCPPMAEGERFFRSPFCIQ
jgi:hypothetical protein